MKTGPATTLRAEQSGSALIAILWVVAILSLLIFSSTQLLFVGAESEANSNAEFQARMLSERGIALASHLEVEPGDRVLVEEFSEAESFEARISSEGSRLNLNTLLSNYESDRIVLEELFVRWGLRFDEAAEVVDNLIDWIDPDDIETNLGAEQRFYLSREQFRRPYNRPFLTLDEVEFVNQFDRVVAANPDWRESFTLLSSGKLDLNEAPMELILVTCECGEAAVDVFLDLRDQMQSGLDYRRFETVEEALALLNIPPGFEERIVNRVSVSDSVRRLVSTGRFGSIAVESVVSVQYNAGVGSILQWTTRRTE
ncbi:MAG: hypothetical protein AAF733_12035 [Verrucomicrobiota bacterium]